jgi:hypothetical protein
MDGEAKRRDPSGHSPNPNNHGLNRQTAMSEAALRIPTSV